MWPQTDHVCVSAFCEYDIDRSQRPSFCVDIRDGGLFNVSESCSGDASDGMPRCSGCRPFLGGSHSDRPTTRTARRVDAQQIAAQDIQIVRAHRRRRCPEVVVPFPAFTAPRAEVLFRFKRRRWPCQDSQFLSARPAPDLTGISRRDSRRPTASHKSLDASLCSSALGADSKLVVRNTAGIM